MTISQVIWKRSIMFGPDDSSDDEEESFSEEEDEKMIKNSESSSSSSDIMLDQSTTTTTSYITVVMAEEQQNDEEDGDQKTVEENTQLASLTIKDPLEINTSEVIQNEELISSTLSEALADIERIETNDSQDENVNDEVTTSGDTTLGNKDKSEIIQQGTWDIVNNDKTISGIDSKHGWLKREREVQMKEIQTVEKEMKSSEELNMAKCLVVINEKSGKKQTKSIIENGSTVQCYSENIAILLSNTKMASLDEVTYKKKEDGLKEGDDNISSSSDTSIHGSSIQLLEYNSSTENTSDSKSALEDFKSSSGDLLVTSSTNMLVSSDVYVHIQNPDSSHLIDKEDNPKELLHPKSSSIICNNLSTDTGEIPEVLSTEEALKLVLRKVREFGA